MAFDAKTDTPVAATAVASADKFVFGDVSADGWDTILAENVLDALIRLSAGSYYAYASSQHAIKDGAGGLAEFISDKLIARQDGGVAGTDEVQIYHDGTHGYVFPRSGDLYLGGHDSLFIGIANAEIQFLNSAVLRHQTGNWYLSSLGYFRCQVQVEANTAGSGSPNILASTESRTLLTNEGTTAENYHTLPTAAAGLDFEFVCQDADGIRIVANTGDTIRDVGTVSASAGYIRSSTIGSVVRLKAINATEWIVVSKQGTWAIDS